MREMGVNMILGMLLLASFIAIIVAHLKRASFQDEVPKLVTCTTVLPAVAYGLPLTSSGMSKLSDSIDYASACNVLLL